LHITEKILHLPVSCSTFVSGEGNADKHADGVLAWQRSQCILPLQRALTATSIVCRILSLPLVRWVLEFLSMMARMLERFKSGKSQRLPPRNFSPMASTASLTQPGQQPIAARLSTHPLVRRATSPIWTVLVSVLPAHLVAPFTTWENIITLRMPESWRPAFTSKASGCTSFCLRKLLLS
jgi:hypothetical protein